LSKKKATNSGIRDRVLAQAVIWSAAFSCRIGPHGTEPKVFRNFGFFEVFSTVR
jgi:hypothetical protein